jgi:hypothetical protein
MSQDLVAIGQLNPECGVGQQLLDNAFDFNLVLLGRR